MPQQNAANNSSQNPKGEVGKEFFHCFDVNIYFFLGTHRDIGHIGFSFLLCFWAKEKPRCPMSLCVLKKNMLN